MQHRLRNWLVGSAVALGATGLSALPAFADAIDGDWCRGASNLNIEGDNIVTPGRNRLKGRYGRYSFTFTAPAGEPDAGSEISLVMIRGLETVHLTRPGQSGAPEVWIRCKPIS